MDHVDNFLSNIAKYVKMMHLFLFILFIWINLWIWVEIHEIKCGKGPCIISRCWRWLKRVASPILWSIQVKGFLFSKLKNDTDVLFKWICVQEYFTFFIFKIWNMWNELFYLDILYNISRSFLIENEIMIYVFYSNDGKSYEGWRFLYRNASFRDKCM